MMSQTTHQGHGGAARPLIGITCNLDNRDVMLRRTYVDAVVKAGGVPVLLPPPREGFAEAARAYAALCDGIVFTGGDDASTERYGEAVHPEAKLVAPDRQRFEEALLEAVNARPALPVLGICLGMQMMTLHAGGKLNQHMPDDTPTHAEHAADNVHEVRVVAKGSVLGLPERARVTSWHHQSVRSPGRLRTVCSASDGVIEAVDDPARPFYAAVQWHPERTAEDPAGLDLFRKLVEAAQRRG